MKQVIYFSANWCSSCQSTEPAIEQLKKVGVQVVKVNTDYDVSLTEQYNIKSVPTVIILENNKEVKRHSGALSFDQLKNLIKG
jgi:thioredoxin 1